MDLRPGDIVFGPDQSDAYSIETLVGYGGFGLVYRVQRATNQTTFALETIRLMTEIDALIPGWPIE